MKRAFLLIVVPALLVALGFAQTPAASINTDQTTIKGCLGGADGNYTVVQDNTGHTFKITASGVDLKPHLGHDVSLIGHRASGTTSAAADNSFAVAELTMISEHCAAAAAAAPVATTTSTLPETAITPAAPATAPAATVTSHSGNCRHTRSTRRPSRGDCRHTRCTRHSTCGDCRHTARRSCCPRCDCHHRFGQTCGGRCSPNGSARPFSEPLSSTCCSRRCTRCDYQQVLGACQYT